MYNNIIIVTPYVKHQSEPRTPVSFHQLKLQTQPDTYQTYTPQPSTPIKHAGSDCLEYWNNINKYMEDPTRIL